MQPETRFKLKVFERLKAIEKIWYFKTQQLALLGIPDIIGCYQGRFFAWELKVGKNPATKLQLHVLQCITRAGGIAVVMGPENLESEIDRLIGTRLEPEKSPLSVDK